MSDKETKKKRGKMKVHDSSKYIELEPNMNEEIVEESELEEVRQPLTIAQRRKRAMAMRRFKTKIAAARKRARKRKASPEKLKMRARRKARNLIRKRLMKNKSYAEMTPAEKVALDKRVTKIPQTVIDRLATRQLPQIRQAELKRLSGSGTKTESLDLNERFSMLFERNVAQDSDISDKEGTQPKKYFSGLAKSTKEKRDAHFKKGVEKDPSDSSAYKPAPGDSKAETKPSSYTKRYHQMFTKENKVKIDRRFKYFKGKDLKESFLDEAHDLMESVESLVESAEKSLKNKASETGISYGILKKVYDRGVAAWRTGHRPGTTPQQWGMARVNSFATGGKTRTTADSDLWAQHSGKKESFELFGEDIDFEQLDEQTLIDKILNAMHKHISKGADIADIAWEISGASGVNMTSRDLIKKYAERYGEAKRPQFSDAKLQAMKKKYGFAEGKEDPYNREEGTDSLVKIYKQDTPYQSVDEAALNADIRRGDRVKFTRISITDPQEDIEGTFVGTDENTGRMRIREDDGKLHIVKHQNVSRVGGVNESFAKNFGSTTTRKSLREFMVNIPQKKDTLGIKRKDMPQVSSQDMDDFKKYLKDNSVNIQKITVDPKSLKASQGEFNKDKIEKQIELMGKSKAEPKAIIISADDYVIDGHHRWLAAMNLGIKMPALRATMKAKQLIDLINKYPKVKNVGLSEAYLYEAFDVICEDDETCPIITMGQMREFEKLVDKLFAKFEINFDFTKHFRERMSDERNKPCINMRELGQMIQKIYNKNKADGKTLSKFTDAEAVVKDLQSNLNMPIAVEYDRRNDELRVVAKTIMRKKDFKTPNPIVRV
jgi:hypothetical protein